MAWCHLATNLTTLEHCSAVINPPYPDPILVRIAILHTSDFQLFSPHGTLRSHYHCQGTLSGFLTTGYTALPVGAFLSSPYGPVPNSHSTMVEKCCFTHLHWSKFHWIQWSSVDTCNQFLEGSWTFWYCALRHLVMPEWRWWNWVLFCNKRKEKQKK